MCISWLLMIMLLSMHGSTMKLSNAQQAKIINNYQNTRLKLLKTNAAIWFNRMCKIKQVKPNYIHFKTNRKTQQDIKTVSQATQYRINQEINLIFVVPCVMLYSGEISPTRCNNCVFYSQWLFSTCFGWQSHPSSGVQCCIWPQVSWLT
jgi:hypothetical protein